jgi:hypothetical protein
MELLLTATTALLMGACPVTPPNGGVPPGFPTNAGGHGNGRIWTILPADGRLVARESDVQPDGSIRRKLPWWTRRSAGRRLHVTGRRLEGRPVRLRARVNQSTTDPDLPRMFPSALFFPREGCWSVTARTGRSALRFVISVSAGPNDRR